MDPMGDFVLWIVESSTGNLQRKKWIPSDPSESVFGREFFLVFLCIHPFQRHLEH